MSDDEAKVFHIHADRADTSEAEADVDMEADAFPNRDVLAALQAPDGYQVDGAYELRANGVYERVERKGKPTSYAKLFSAPVIPVRVFVDSDGEELVELAWLWYGNRIAKAVPRSVVKSGRRLVTHLGNLGFPVMDSNAKDMEAWLDSAEHANQEVIPVVKVARYLGWQPDAKTFVLGNGRPHKIELGLPLPGIDKAIEAYRPKGTLEEWQEVVEDIANYPIAKMAVYASLSATLLRVLGLNSFLVDFCGETTRGKTTSVRLADSVWAHPLESEAKWSATRVWLEHRLSIAHGVPVVIDETQSAERDETVRDMLYSIPQNAEKNRGAIQGVRKTLAWHTVVLSTGEKSIVDFSKDGGTAGRVLSVYGPPLGSGNGALAQQIAEGYERVYGVAGPVFVKHLRSRLGSKADVAELRKRHAVCTGKFNSGGDLQRRRSPMVGALYLAAELADECELLPFKVPPLEEWAGLFSYEDSHDDRPYEAREVVRNFIAANPQRVQPSPKAKWAGPEPSHGWAGKDLGGGVIAMNPEVLAEVLRRAGYQLDAVLKIWAERGYLLLGDRQIRKQVRVGSQKVRWICFKGFGAVRKAGDGVVFKGESDA